MTKASSDFNWRYATLDDYGNVLCKWWEAWKFPAPLPGMLPKGVIISKEGVDVYAGFLYLTGTSMAWVEYIVSNKYAPNELKRGGLDRLIDVVSILAKDKGVSTLFTSTVSKPLINGLLKSGFVIGDENCTQLLKNL